MMVTDLFAIEGMRAAAAFGGLRAQQNISTQGHVCCAGGGMIFTKWPGYL